MIKWLLIMLAVTTAAAALLFWQPSLESIHKKIVNGFDSVKHMSADEFSLLDSSQTIVFDVREEGEFAVSHLPNAVLVSPDLDAQEFIKDYSDLIIGKQAVFYCSVGRRSSDLVQRVQQLNPKLKLVNLEGGLFNWVNQERDVVGKGIHPYNAYWGRLIDDPNKIQYEVQ